MSYTLVFNSEAEQEYREAYEWYEAHLVGLGDRFETEIENQLLKIISNTQAYHFSKGNFREASIAQFPFSIVYKVNTRKQIIYISAIYHSSRDPKSKYRK